MTEYQKMCDGQPYDSGDATLATMRLRARMAARQFNDAPEDALPLRLAILKEHLGAMGENVYLEPSLRFDYACNTYIGDDCYFNFNTTFLDCAPIRIGKNVLVGPNVSFLTPAHSLDFMQRRSTVQPDGSTQCIEFANPITIEDDVWISGSVSICGGVTIGKGSVIGANAVVTRDIPPCSFAAGNPCRVIRTILPEDRI